VLLLLVLAVVLSFSSVQTKVAKEATEWVNKEYDLDVDLASFRYVFPNQIQLREVFLPDQDQDTLIYAKALNVSIGGFNQLSATLALNAVEGESLKFHLLTKAGDSTSNLQWFISKFSSGDTTKKPKPFSMIISDLELSDSKFWLENLNCEGNCTAFKIVDLNTTAENFYLEGSDFGLEINNMQANDQYGLRIKELWGGFTYKKDQMVFSQLHLKTDRSQIDGDYGMYYNSISDMSDYVNKVHMEADLQESSISSEDIQHFASAFPDFDTFKIEGKASGVVNALSLKDILLELGTGTSVSGQIRLEDPTKVDKLFIDASEFKVETNTTDADHFYSMFTKDTLPEIVNRLGTTSFDGHFEGTLSNFNTEGVLLTDLGRLESDLNFRKPATGPVQYQGFLKIHEFDLGSLLENKALGIVKAELNLDGKGFSPTSMKTDLLARISRFDANKYAYQDIKLDGKIAKGHFIGSASVNDPNLNFKFNGDATFTADTSDYDFTAIVEKANLKALNFTEEPVALVSGELDIKLEARDYEDWTGSLKLANVTYENKDRFYFFEDVLLLSEDLDTANRLRLKSTIADAELLGNFTYAGLSQVFVNEVAKYAHELTPKPIEQEQNFNFLIDVKNTKVITELFIEELAIDPATHFEGTYRSNDSRLMLNLKSPGIGYDENRVQDIKLNYSGSVLRSSLSFDVNKLKLASGLEIDSIKLGNFYYNDTLFYNLGAIFQDSVDGRLELHGYALQADTSKFEVGVFRSSFNVGYENFEILPDNKFFIDTGGVYIQNLLIENNQKKLAINGNISDNENEILRVSLQGFHMNLINYFLATPEARFNGNLYGDVILSQLLSKPRFAADIYVDSLFMNKTMLGNFSLYSDWAMENDTIYLGANMELGELETFSLGGYYQASEKGKLNFDVDFERFRMAALNPFLVGIAENVRGYLDGKIKVNGPVSAPKISGAVSLPKTAFTISFLQTDYNFEGTPTITFEQNEIKFPDLKLRDSKFGTRGSLSGTVKHNNFRDFKLNLNINANELLVLNTPGTSEDAYYGTAFVSGVIRMKGPPSQLEVTSDITTERNTTFNIPLSGSRNESQSSFVAFIDQSKPDTSNITTAQRFDIDKGIALNFDMNVNENAQVSIILDERTGNALKATGNGNIRLGISKGGEMDLYGTYTIKEGLYNFNLQGFLNKEFQVESGSSVAFNGSPFDAIVDITAKYVTRADPSPVVPGYTGGRVLTEVYLTIQGNLATPRISFDIKTPRASALVQTIVGNIGSDANKTEQVFGLLATNSFIPETGISDGTGTGQINGWDILANQAASTLNQLTDRFDLSLNYQSDPNGQPLVEGNSQEELEVGVSTSFLDDRVTVSTSLGVPVGANQSELAGEVQVEYSITKDGRFRAKVFNRELENNFVTQNTYQQGAGVFYRIDFNDGSDFWNKLFGREEEKPKPKVDSTPTPPDTSSEVKEPR
jgi:hypothetical protein